MLVACTDGVGSKNLTGEQIAKKFDTIGIDDNSYVY